MLLLLLPRSTSHRCANDRFGATEPSLQQHHIPSIPCNGIISSGVLASGLPRNGPAGSAVDSAAPMQPRLPPASKSTFSTQSRRGDYYFNAQKILGCLQAPGYNNPDTTITTVTSRLDDNGDATDNDQLSDLEEDSVDNGDDRVSRLLIPASHLLWLTGGFSANFSNALWCRHVDDYPFV